MINFKYFSLFIIINFIFVNINAQLPGLVQPLIEAQRPLTTDILDLYGLANNDPCSYNIFKCYNITGTGLVVGEINIANVPAGKTYTITDLSPFAVGLEYLYISDDKITIDDSFWNTIDQFANLKKVRVYKQSSNIASTSFPSSLNEVIIDNYGGQISELFFTSNLESLVFNGTLSGFSYGFAQFPSNDKIKNLYLVADTTLPSGFANLQGVIAFSLKIDNRKDLTAFTIPNEFNSFSNIYSISFLFTTDNPVYAFPSSIQSVSTMNTLFITGNGFVTPSSSYDFTLNENIKFDLNGLSNFLSCPAKPCIKTNQDSRFSTVGSSYSTNNIDFSNYKSIYISGNTVAQTLPEINYSNIKRAYFVNSNFNGAISEQYCNIRFDRYSFANNKLTSLPQCLVCSSVLTQVQSILLPNSFNVAVPPSNPCLVKKTITRDTNGGMNTIEIEGNALGFEGGLTTTPRTNVIAPIVTLNPINTLVTVDTFPGEGSNNVFSYNFTGSILELTVSYVKPTITDYILDNYTLSIQGTGYSITNRNVVNIVNSRSGKSVEVSATSYDGVSFNFSRDVFEDIEGRSLIVQVNVADQSSNKVEIIDPDYPSTSSILSPIFILNITILLSLLVLYI